MDLLSKLISIGAVKDRLRLRLKKLILGVASFLVAGFAVLAGLVFLVASGWVALRDHYDAVTANLIVGLGFLVIAVIAFVGARAMLKSSANRTAKARLKEDADSTDPDVAAADLLTGENLVAATTLMLGVGYLIGNRLFSKNKSS